MSLPAGASIMLVARSESTLPSRQTLPTNTSSKAIARPVALAVTFSTSTSSSSTTASTSTSTSTSTSLSVPVVALAELNTASTSSAAIPVVVDPIAKALTSTSVILLTTTSSSTEQGIVTQSTQTTTSSQTSPSPQIAIESPSSIPTQTTTVPPPSTSTSPLAIQSTTTSSSVPTPLFEINGSLVSTSIPSISSASSSDSSSTNTASAMIAIPLPIGQTTLSNLTPVSTTPVPFPTKAAGENPAQSSAGNMTTTNTTPIRDVGPMMGGVIGGLAFVGILFFLWWRIHKKRRSRHSVYTPTVAHFHRRNLSEKYEIDGESLGPTPRSARWRAQTSGLCSRVQRNFTTLLISVKTRLVTENDAPSVNLNRGNSQFLEPSPQHSRSNSTTNQAQDNSHVNHNAFGNRWNRLTDDVKFSWFRGKKSGNYVDPFADTRRINENDTYTGEASPQFSPFPSGDLNFDQTIQSRRSLSLGTFPKLTFPELSVSAQPTIPDLSRPPAVVILNPFADPTDPTSPFTSRPNTTNSVPSSQRTRGLSQPLPTGQAAFRQYTFTLPMKATPTPRYPPPIRTSQINDRDSFVSPISASDREIKGRSDPFDLERAELRQTPGTSFMHNQNQNVPVSPFSTKGISQGMPLQPRTETTQVAKHQRMVSDAPTYGSSKYSSGFSLLDHWGDSGATVEPLLWNKPSLQHDKATRNERNTNSSMKFNDTVGMAL